MKARSTPQDADMGAASTPAAVGLRAKTGRAILVALGGPLESPRLLLRREIVLTAPDVPASFQPYHHVMELPWDEAAVAVRATQSVIEGIASETIREVLRDLESQRHPVAAVGVVGSPDRDLTRIGNRHIRTHAAEGILFRRVLEEAAARNNAVSHTLSDRDTERLACERLAWPPRRLEQVLLALGRAAGPPWRVDERLAATAALLCLRSS